MNALSQKSSRFEPLASVLSDPPKPIGCDDGHFAIKVCAGPESFFTMPSRASIGRQAASAINGGTNNDLIYETAEGEYVTITAGDSIGDSADTRNADYPISSTNRALVYHALRESGVRGDINLVSGLPVNRFYISGERNVELIESKRQSLMRPVHSVSGAILPIVRQHKVLSEAVAAFYDALINMDGSVNHEFKEISDEEPIAVVDAGGKTLDIATVKEGGTGLYPSRSGTADAGALYVYDELNTFLRREFNVAQDVPFAKLQLALTKGTYRVFSEKHDVSHAVNQMLDNFADRVGFEVVKLLGDGSRFGRVLFVGGAANLLATRLERVFPGVPLKAITVAPVTDDPKTNASYANARGMYKAALLSSQS